MNAPIPFEEPTKGTSWSRIIMRALLAAGIIALLVRYGRQLVDEFEALDTWVESLGPAAPLAFVLLLAVTIPLFLPVTAMKIAAGAIFNPIIGALLFLAGQYLAALLIYLIGRHLLSERIRAWTQRNPKLSVLSQAAERGTAKRQFLVRMTPLSFTLVSYVLSALGVSMRSYMLGCLASVPSTFATVWFASAARKVTVLVDEPSDTEEARSWTTIAIAAVALALLVGLVRWARPRLVAMHEHSLGARTSR